MLNLSPTLDCFIVRMKKLRFLIPLLAIIAAITASAASPTASQLVDDAAARLRQAKSVVISFKATGKTPADSYNGTFTLSGNKFAIDAPEAKVWYDGKTQWTWTAASGEVNITEPTVEEVAQVNPYSILSSLRSRYKARYQGQPLAADGSAHSLDARPAGGPCRDHLRYIRLSLVNEATHGLGRRSYPPRHIGQARRNPS